MKNGSSFQRILSLPFTVIDRNRHLSLESPSLPTFNTIFFIKSIHCFNISEDVYFKTSSSGPEVRSGDLQKPIILATSQEFTFIIERGFGIDTCVSVNYDDFVNDAEIGDMLLVDGGMMSFMVKSKTEDSVKCEVDGVEIKSRRHLNIRGENVTLASIIDKDWDDIKFGVDNQGGYYVVSFVKDANVIYELKEYLRSCNADIHVIPKIKVQILYRIFILLLIHLMGLWSPGEILVLNFLLRRSRCCRKSLSGCVIVWVKLLLWQQICSRA